MALIERTFREKIVLVGVIFPGQSEDLVEEHLDELALLVDTAGADVLARVHQRRDHPDPATFVGKGKAEELREVSEEVDADTGELIGNFPQAFSHIGLVNAAWAIAQAEHET